MTSVILNHVVNPGDNVWELLNLQDDTCKSVEIISLYPSCRCTVVAPFSSSSSSSPLQLPSSISVVSTFSPHGKAVDVIITPSHQCAQSIVLAQQYLARTIYVHSIPNKEFLNIRNLLVRASFIVEAQKSFSHPETTFVVGRQPSPTCPSLSFLNLTDSCLDVKLKEISTSFAHFLPQQRRLELIRSPSFASRLRCRFGLRREDDDGDDDEGVRTSNTPATPATSAASAAVPAAPLSYFMFDTRNTVKTVTTFPIAATPIQRMMPMLLTELNKDLLLETDTETGTETKNDEPSQPNILSKNVRAVHFRGTLDGDMLITLIYDAPVIDEKRWREAALGMKLGEWVEIMGRSKGQVVSTSERRHVNEILKTKDGVCLKYEQPEGSFSNPNGRINEKCLDWLCDVVKRDIVIGSSSGSSSGPGSSSERSSMREPQINLLELYCGSGNHTMALSSSFHQIVAVELDQQLVNAAKRNAKTNHVENITFIRLHSAKFCRKILLKKNYKGIEFHAVLVDPPRSGLDELTLQCVSLYDHILYISCNPVPLLRDLTALATTHDVIRFAGTFN